MSELRSELRQILDEETQEEALRRRLVERLLAIPPRPPKMSFDEFIEWLDEDVHAELVDGEVVMSSPADQRHQDISLFLASTLDLDVRSRNLGKIQIAPFQMRLPDSSREPDLLFLANDHLHRLKPTYLDGPADLVIEILSPESIGRDRGEKFVEYESASIPEYWMIDPRARRFEQYILNDQKRFAPVLWGSSGKIQSKVIPGFWLEVEWLWQDPLPSALQTVANIAGLDAELLQAFEKALRG